MCRTTALAVALALTMPASALEIDPMVTPEVNIGGRALVSLDSSETQASSGEDEGDTELSTADSSLLFGFSKYLFSDEDYGFAVVGVKTTEAGSELEQDLYLHQVYAGVGGARYEISAGRQRLPNTLVSFPTLRDDDLVEFTHVGNALVDSHVEEYQIYGSQIAARWWMTPAWSVAAATTARAETVDGGEVDTGRFNGQSLILSFDIPEAAKVGRGLRYAGLGIDRQELGVLSHGTDKDILAYVAGAVVYLNDNPEADWSLDVQAINVDGVSVADLAEAHQRAEASSWSAVAALRYGHRPALQTRWQASLTAGYRDYTDFDSATSLTLVPGFAYWVGSGVEVLAQYRYLKNDGSLARDTGIEREQSVYLGLSFLFDYTLNETVGSRRGILAHEHQMSTIGPALGGH